MLLDFFCFFFKLKRLHREMTGSSHFVLHVVFKFYLFIATASHSCSNQRHSFIPPPSLQTGRHSKQSSESFFSSSSVVCFFFTTMT